MVVDLLRTVVADTSQRAFTLPRRISLSHDDAMVDLNFDFHFLSLGNHVRHCLIFWRPRRTVARARIDRVDDVTASRSRQSAVSVAT